MKLEDVKRGWDYVYEVKEGECDVGTCRYVGPGFVVMETRTRLYRVNLSEVYYHSDQWGKQALSGGDS